MNYSIEQFSDKEMKIQSIIGIKDKLMLVFSLAETSYYFSIVDGTGKSSTCDTNFPSANSAKFMGLAAIKSMMEIENN